MKKRLRKKLLKKTQQIQSCAVHPQQSGVETEQLKGLAVECWRIRNLLPEFVCSNKQPVLSSVVNKMGAMLTSMGIEVEDPTGWDYKDGMTMNVALFEENSTLPNGTRTITETLSPNVYVAGTLVQSARIIVSVGKGDK